MEWKGREGRDLLGRRFNPTAKLNGLYSPDTAISPI
jgi:hypothetical protein